MVTGYGEAGGLVITPSLPMVEGRALGRAVGAGSVMSHRAQVLGSFLRGFLTSINFIKRNTIAIKRHSVNHSYIQFDWPALLFLFFLSYLYSSILSFCSFAHLFNFSYEVSLHLDI